MGVSPKPPPLPRTLDKPKLQMGHVRGPELQSPPSPPAQHGLRKCFTLRVFSGKRKGVPFSRKQEPLQVTGYYLSVFKPPSEEWGTSLKRPMIYGPAVKMGSKPNVRQEGGLAK